MWKLVIEDDEGNRTVVPLTRDQYSIGRRDGNTIRLTERNVSRDHARLLKKNGAAAPKNGGGGAGGEKNGSGNGAASGAGAGEGQGQGQASQAKKGEAPASSSESSSDPAVFVLEDLTSYNGVFVNGLRISHAQDLSLGDLVQIGDYRIVLQDESQPQPGVTSTEADASKVTLPGAPYARASGLLERPNRLVMLAGPTPGTEYPLDRDLMTIGRAEDSSISVNHNSVSRTHCEVHALGQGRYEIVDKGSSNGVRVNGADLRRGIVEPGDTIELGDVRFKFVGAGQIFRPSDSQQFTTLDEGEATEIMRSRRSAMAVPAAVFLGIVAVGALFSWLHARPRAEASASLGAVAAAPSREQLALDEAKRACAAGDCDAARARLEAAVSEASPLRGSQDFKDVENRWADQLLARADGETDPTRKRGMYQLVSQSVGVDAGRRKVAADKLQQLDTISGSVAAEPTQLPIAAAPAPQNDTPAPGRSRAAQVQEPSERPGPVAALPAPPAAAPPAAPPSKSGVDDRERQLALQGTQDSKVLLKQQLEPRVFGGRASDTEIRLLISTCKDLGDKACVAQARAVWAQKKEQ
jgi:pSer/pThr/pTyr-binding forkhead associated (FHA) protein